jgi:hypothetical protein
MDQELQRPDVSSAGLLAFLGLKHSDALSPDDAEFTQPLIERNTAERSNDHETLDETVELLEYPG